MNDGRNTERLGGYRKLTLDWINEILQGRGAPLRTDLPKGQPNSPYSCPVAEALGCYVQYSGDNYDLYVTDYDDMFGLDTTIQAPDFVENFVKYFDRGAYPDLIAR